MTTTISLDSGLLAAARAEARVTGVDLATFVETAVRREIDEGRNRKPPALSVLPAAGGDGLLPGVDLDDGSALLDLLEDR